MTDRKEVEKIVEKYNNDYAKLQNNATRKEFRLFLSYLAEEANRKQRQLVGLDKDTVGS